jgi:hypothetical protein
MANPVLNPMAQRLTGPARDLVNVTPHEYAEVVRAIGGSITARYEAMVARGEPHDRIYQAIADHVAKIRAHGGDTESSGHAIAELYAFVSHHLEMTPRAADFFSDEINGPEPAVSATQGCLAWLQGKRQTRPEYKNGIPCADILRREGFAEIPTAVLSEGLFNKLFHRPTQVFHHQGLKLFTGHINGVPLKPTSEKGLLVPMIDCKSVQKVCICDPTPACASFTLSWFFLT